MPVSQLPPPPLSAETRSAALPSAPVAEQDTPTEVCLAQKERGSSTLQLMPWRTTSKVNLCSSLELMTASAVPYNEDALRPNNGPRP